MGSQTFDPALNPFHAMMEMAKEIKDLSDAPARYGKVIELQSQILNAQGAQAALIDQVRDLEAKVRRFETWIVEKQRYELKELASGIMAYSLKPDVQPTEPAHSICPDCYEEGVKAILTQVIRYPGMARVSVCQRCGWEAYTSGQWRSEHGSTKSASRRR